MHPSMFGNFNTPDLVVLMLTETTSAEFRREPSSVHSPGLWECSLPPPPCSSPKAGDGIATLQGRLAFVDSNRNLLSYFKVMDTKLEGFFCFPQKYALQCPPLFAHCLKSKTQVLHFIVENKIFHIIPELGMPGSTAMFLDLTQLMYTAIFSTQYWRTGKT